ncbi:unnamed protein product [Rotaria socialis]|uniref:Uncharacterized protein n=1 Tax=Rotaria socialis TaxID=392032 RepID=A0A821Y2N5_9BILA|nr:unnamed protein product [Rotaria socialis]CAF4951994.1 unnamed protein product [Rotaria socialis]
MEEKKLSDGKTIGGKNRLSVHNILRLQMTFASTIRKSKHDLDLLFKGSRAIFWHKYSTNDDPHHNYCSIDWCGYLKSVRDKTPYDHTSHALSRPVLDAIKPVFNNLCSRESLTRVVDASTQNPNEGFHSLVWLMSPKHKASSGTTFEIACCLAVMIFNDGYFALGDIFNVMCGYRGYYTDQAMVHFDNNRLHTESKENNRKRRKEAGRVLMQNDDEEEDNDSIIDGADQIDDDNNDTNPVTGETTVDNDTTTDSDDHVTDDNDSISSSDESLDDDYGYYNPKDKRTWTEEQ